MQYCSYEHIRKESIEIPDGVPFIVNRENGYFCFAMKIRLNFTLTPWKSQDIGEEEAKQYIDQSMRQLRFCKKNGWSKTGVKGYDPDEMDQRTLFMCLYCRGETFDITEPCICRGVTNKDRVTTTSSGIILPY